MTVEIWPVLVADWEIECCGTPPGVGDEVTWKLSFRSEEEDIFGFPGNAVADLSDASVEPAPSELTLLRDGTLSAEWARPDAVTTPGRGFLWEGHHHLPNPGTPATEGQIRRVRLVASIYERAEGVRWTPVRGQVGMRDVDRSPKWFRGPRPGDEHRALHEIGVLVDLAVPP